MINHGFRRLALAHSLLPGDPGLTAAQAVSIDELPLAPAGVGRAQGEPGTIGVASEPSPNPLPQVGEAFRRR
jgi:hypothetical protein